jgi:hypothetical protein
LNVANSILPDVLHKKMYDWKVSLGQKPAIKDKANLGLKWYTKFLKRHANVLKTKKPKKFPNDRAKWATYENIEEMYNRVYQALVDSGVANYTDETKTKLEMLHPKYLLFGDELGVNTNMKETGNRNEKRVIEVGGDRKAKESASASDNTILPISNALGEDVLCVVILKGLP